MYVYASNGNLTLNFTVLLHILLLLSMSRYRYRTKLAGGGVDTIPDLALSNLRLSTLLRQNGRCYTDPSPTCLALFNQFFLPLYCC